MIEVKQVSASLSSTETYGSLRGKKKKHIPKNRAACCYVLSVVNALNMHDTGTLLQAQLALSGNTKKTHGANQRNKTTIQCMMHSQNRHSRSLTFDLFSFSNSPRPPLAGLYTTCIYKQYKGLTAVCTRRPPVCLTD